jgi:hypothetical protein
MYFDKQHRLGNDECWINSQNVQSKNIYEYQSFNPYKTNTIDCQSNVNELRDFVVENNLHFKEGYGFTNACFVDTDTELRNQSILTQGGKCKNQLSTRLFTAVPNLRNGTFETEVESRLVQGDVTGNDKSCEPNKGKAFDVFTPLIPCLARTVQNVDHIVPKWVRGGEHTRDNIKQKDFLEKNGFELNGNTWQKKKCTLK